MTCVLASPISAIQTMNETKLDDEMSKSLTHDKSLKMICKPTYDMFK